MKPNPHISDEVLSAYVDGELDAAQAAEVARALAADAVLAQRLKRQQQVKAQLRGAFDPVLSESVPQRLMQMIEAAGSQESATVRPATVTDLAAARAARSARATGGAPRSWTRWALTASAMAASLVLGLVLSSVMLRESAAPFAARGGQLVARGTLDRALTQSAAGTLSAGDDAHIGLTFRAQDGRYCRTFSLQQTTGFACRDGAQWTVEMTAQAAAPSAPGAEYRQAASDLPPAVRAAIEARIAGDTLDAAAESALIKRGWK